MRVFETRSEADPYFVRAQVEGLVLSYLGDTDPKNPLASPLYGNLAGLPPISIHVGDDEVLRDDSRRYFERAVAAGVDARLDVWEGMPHGFVGSVGTLAAAAKGVRCCREVSCTAAQGRRKSLSAPTVEAVGVA